MPRSSRSLALSRDVNWPPRIWLTTSSRSKAGSRPSEPDVTGPNDRLGAPGRSSRSSAAARSLGPGRIGGARRPDPVQGVSRSFQLGGQRVRVDVARDDDRHRPPEQQPRVKRGQVGSRELATLASVPASGNR